MSVGSVDDAPSPEPLSFTHMAKSTPTASAPAITQVMVDRIEHWPIEKLVPYKNNARKHPASQLRKIATSIQQYGFVQPLLVDENEREIIAGHGRLEAAKLLGLKVVPVIPVSHLSERQRHAYVIADNRLAELASWDEGILAEEINTLLAGLPELPELGFSPRELEELLEPTKPTPAQAEAVPTPEPGRPTSKRGDLWLLGDHRLLCADFRDEAGRARLLQGRAVDCVLTDPPYAIYGSSTGVDGDVADDRMVREFFGAVLRAAASGLRIGGHAYIFCDWRSWPSWWDEGRDSGLVPKNLLVWDKLTGSGSGTNYGNAYELAGFWHRANKKKRVAEADVPTSYRAVGASNLLKSKRVDRAEFERAEGGRSEHAAQKPVELLRELACNSSEPGERVLDLFSGSGSGSCLIACEVAKRRGLAIEIEPKWIDTAVRRWQRLTGRAATLEGEGGTFDEIGAARAQRSNKAPRKRTYSTAAVPGMAAVLETLKGDHETEVTLLRATAEATTEPVAAPKSRKPKRSAAKPRKA